MKKIKYNFKKIIKDWLDAGYVDAEQGSVGEDGHIERGEPNCPYDVAREVDDDDVDEYDHPVDHPVRVDGLSTKYKYTEDGEEIEDEDDDEKS